MSRVRALDRKPEKEPDPDDADAVLEKLQKPRPPRIRCPKCGYQPKKTDRWMCFPGCRHLWNTFDTRGVCPNCGFRWLDTKCLACNRWSAHEAWYERGDDEPLH